MSTPPVPPRACRDLLRDLRYLFSFAATRHAFWAERLLAPDWRRILLGLPVPFALDVLAMLAAILLLPLWTLFILLPCGVRMCWHALRS